MPRYEDEQNNEADTDQYREKQNHHSPLVKHFSNVRLSYAGPVHECIFAKAGQSKNRIKGVLLRSKGIYADGEG